MCCKVAKEIQQISISRFMRDSIRIRMDAVLLYSWSNKQMDRFHKWRLKYLDYVKLNHPSMFTLKVK